MNEAKVFCVDIDGVIATITPNNDYCVAGPRRRTIAAINRLFDDGHRIILFTARGTVTGIDWREETERQLREWGVRHHELHFGKPAADYYVDDRNLSIEEFESIGTFHNGDARPDGEAS